MTTVLLVENNAELREATRDLLSELGYTVLTASRWEPADDVEASRGDVDVVVIDADLAGPADGEAVGSRVVLANRGESWSRIGESAIVLRKPFSSQELGAAVELAMKRRTPIGRQRESAAVEPASAGLTVRPPPGRWAAAGSLTAALTLLLAAGLLWRTNDKAAPPLPAPVAGSVTRGAGVEVEGPSGELDEMPRELRWRAVSGASSYRATLQTEDGEIVWQTAVSAQAGVGDLVLELPRDLSPGVVYSWRLEALDDTGQRMAWAPPGRFRLSPVPSLREPNQKGVP